jgi:hypothetical protein
MSRRHKRAAKRIADLECMLQKAATHIESAADVIESLDGDDVDGECEAERVFAGSLRQIATTPWCYV